MTNSDTSPGRLEHELRVVAQDGSGDHTTITAAVAAAQDGDTVLVRPGTYVEAVVIKRDITLTGDGPREGIVITAPEDGPMSSVGEGRPAWAAPYAVLLLANEATLSNLPFQGERSQVHATGGSPTLTNLAFDSVGVVYRCDGTEYAIIVYGGSTATVTSSTLADGGPIGVFGGSEPLIEGNTLIGGPQIVVDNAVRRGMSPLPTNPLVRGHPASPMVKGNTTTDPGQDGLTIRSGSAVVRGTSSAAPDSQASP